MLSESLSGAPPRHLQARVQPDVSHTTGTRMGAVTDAIRAHCLKTCTFGPTVCTLKHGPDGPSELSVTTCQAPCQENLDDALVASRGEGLRDVIAKAGADYVVTDHYDDEVNPS